MRAESQLDTFAAALDEATAPETPPPPARPGKTADAPATDTAIEKPEDVTAEANENTVVPALAVVPNPPPAPTITAEAASTATEDGTTIPAAPPVPALPVDAAPVNAAPLPPPAAAPVPVPLPVAGSKPPETLSDDVHAAPEAATAETSALALPDEASAPPRLRDTIEQARTGNAAASHATTGNSPTVTPESNAATTTANPPSPQATQTDAAPVAAKAAAEPAATTTTKLDPTEPPQALQSTTPAETRATQATAAATPALSTLSQGAIHATAQIAARVIKALEGRSTRFEMALTPDDLGRVDVSLDIDADGQLSARLAFDNPLAAADLRGRVDELRRQLTDAGFTVSDDALSFDQREPSAGNGSAFDRGQRGNTARAFGAASRLSLDAEASLVPARWMSLTLTPERVDMKV